MTEKKRTDKILDLLDGALQSTTPRHFGSGGISPDTCVGCAGRPAIEGRSWCEHCLPENDEKAPEPDVPTLTTLPGFSLGLPLIEGDEPVLVESMIAVHFTPDRSGSPVAGIFVDADDRPVALGIDLMAMFLSESPDDVVTALSLLVVGMIATGTLPDDALDAPERS
jgi:hypothetical protein